MIEEIKNLKSKLKRHFIIELGILQQGGIDVAETGTDDDVAPEIAEAWNSREPARIKPTIDATRNLDRSGHIRSHRIGYTVDRGVAGDQVYGIAALQLHDRADLPAILNSIAPEGQLVNSVQHKT